MYTELEVNLGDISINDSQIRTCTLTYTCLKLLDNFLNHDKTYLMMKVCIKTSCINKHKLKFAILPKVNFTKCIYTSHTCGNCSLRLSSFSPVQMVHHLRRRKEMGEIWGCRHMVEARHGNSSRFTGCNCQPQ